MNNILVITGDFNIKDNNLDPSYPHHSIYTDTLREIADSVDLELSMPINQVSTRYANNLNKSNSGIDLMFFHANSNKFNNYSIISNLWHPSKYVPLMVDIVINEEFIQINHQTIIKNSEEEEHFITKLKEKIGNIDTTNTTDHESLKRVVQDFPSISDNLWNKYFKCVKITKCSKAW